MDILALLFMRNASPHIERVLRNLIEQGLTIHVVDNESLDNSAVIAKRFLGYGVVDVETVPYPGHFDLRSLLDRIEEVAASSGADWLIKCDSDEILEAPAPFTTLREGIGVADAAGYNVINFDEFVFLPTAEDTEGFEGTDFVHEMRYYYFFEPGPLRLQRAWKNRAGSTFGDSGGHRLDVADKRIYPTPFILRHYIALSRLHAISKYAGRIHNVEAYLERRWHSNRIHFAPDKLALPSRARLKFLGEDATWDKTDPWRKHEFLGTQPLGTARQALAPPPRIQTHEPPAPFVVGVGRSGTTLLRMMLDMHTELAIPPETHFVPRLAGLQAKGAHLRKRFVETLTSAPAWPDLQIPDEAIIAALRDIEPFDLAEGVRTIYQLYAGRFEKPRWGDQTPLYNRSMLTIARLLPEVRFVHVIQDGRDVAVSGRGLWFGSGASVVDQAANWMWRIRQSRQQAQGLEHYLEIRYEDLVLDTEPTLQAVCEFIDLPYEPVMLTHHVSAARRPEELGNRRDGERTLETAQERRGINRLVEAPPDPRRIGRWRTEMTPEQIADFEAVAGLMLEELGYRGTLGEAQRGRA